MQGGSPLTIIAERIAVDPELGLWCKGMEWDQDRWKDVHSDLMFHWCPTMIVDEDMMDHFSTLWHEREENYGIS